MKKRSVQGIRKQLKDLYVRRIVSGELHPGDRLEVIRIIAQRNGVSHVTASNLISDLVDEGWVESHVGRGTFVVDKPPYHLCDNNLTSDTGFYPDPVGGRRNLNFIYGQPEFSSVSMYHKEVFNAIQESLRGTAWNLTPYFLAGDEEGVRNVIADRCMAGVIMSYIPDNLRDLVYEQIEKSAVVLVQYGMGPASLTNHVIPDNFTMGELVGKHLLAKGHRNVRFLTAKTANRKKETGEFEEQHHMHQRLEGLRTVFGQVGVKVGPPMRWDIEDPVCRCEMSALFEDVAAKKPGSPSALVVGNMLMASELVCLADMMRVKVPEDLSFITFERRQVGDFDTSSITTVDFSRETMGRMVLDLWRHLSRFPNDGPLRCLVPVKLYEGKTVRQL